MDIRVTSSGDIIDQCGMSGSERLHLACTLRDAWWDCHREFMRQVVDIDALGLTPASLTALADDLAEAGYHGHAGVVRRAASPATALVDGPAPSQWRARVHAGRTARVAF